MYNSILLFLNIGGQEMIFIFVIALFLFGGKKLPELARGLGKGLREFKDASETIKRDINEQINDFEKDVVKTPAPKTLTENSSVPATDNVTDATASAEASDNNPAENESSAPAAATEDYSDPTMDPNYSPEYDGHYQPNYDYSIHADEATNVPPVEVTESADQPEPVENKEESGSKTE